VPDGEMRPSTVATAARSSGSPAGYFRIFTIRADAVPIARSL